MASKKPNNKFGTLRPLLTQDNVSAGQFHKLSALEEQGLGQVSRLPISLRMLLETLLRNCDDVRVLPEHVLSLCAWEPNAQRTQELPFIPARILLQDLNGVPIIADLAAMRDIAKSNGIPVETIAPQVPVALVVDHSIQVDHYGSSEALSLNMNEELARNRERFEFLKWGEQNFTGFRVIEPGVGICHQVNLESLATGVLVTDGIVHSDSVVCPDSHTTMINGLGILGWGVGGIEAEAGMLGQPVFLLTPNVTGVELIGTIPVGATATDAVLYITEKLRQFNVVGDFVEFFGGGVETLSVPTRATIANMAPEYGAFIGFFPSDEKTLGYYRDTARQPDLLRAYLAAQGLLGIPKAGEIDYSRTVRINLAEVEPCVAGPRRPQDRVPLSQLKTAFYEWIDAPAPGGFGYVAPERRRHEAPLTLKPSKPSDLEHGDVLLAAITSCTNTSNPSVMIAAGLLAKNAQALGLRVSSRIKTSMAPGSKAVTATLREAGLLEPLEHQGFSVVAYGCTTCIGNSGPLEPEVEEELRHRNIVGCSVLSGNRNFEGRIHASLRANFLASPPLVVAFALAGRMDIDMSSEPLGVSTSGEPVYLADIWPTDVEIEQVLARSMSPDVFAAAYAHEPENQSPWEQILPAKGDLYAWPESTYILRPPFFDDFTLNLPVRQRLIGGRALGIYGHSLTTDHISPAGAIPTNSAAGQYLQTLGTPPADFNTYGARRGNHEVMVRGTFAHARIRNLILPVGANGEREEGGLTILQPERNKVSIYDAAARYREQGVPAFIFGGREYGTGSARDWAAKGTRLLDVAAVIVSSFERIHRLNLVLTGVLPVEFKEGYSTETLGLTGTEKFDLVGADDLAPAQTATLNVRYEDGRSIKVPVLIRLDTPIEVQYYLHGGITPYVLRKLFDSKAAPRLPQIHSN